MNIILRKHLAWFISVLVGCLCTTLNGQEGLIEYRFKAVYLLNFLQFTSWPDAAFQDKDYSPIVIGIIGHDPFGKILDETMLPEKINNHPLVIKRLAANDEPDKCHMLFISKSEQNRLTRLLEKVKDKPVLTVSDISGFAESGGIIQLYMQDNKIKFSINTNSLHSSGVQISSKLLRLANLVGGNF